MRTLYTLLGWLLLCSIQGCSHIPDPGQVPEVEPGAILQNVRCEVKHALEFEQAGKPLLLAAKIGYGLRLKAEEQTSQSFGPNIKWPILHGFISLGLTADSQTERYTDSRTNIEEQMKKVLEAKCGQIDARNATLYPIVGSLGLNTIIRRYVEVAELGDVSKDGFLQELKFRLRFKGGLKPTYELIPSLNRSTTGMFEFTGLREDTHILTVAITPYSKPAPSAIVRVQITNADEIISTGKKPKRFLHNYSRRKATSNPLSTPLLSVPQSDVGDSISKRQNQQLFEEFIQERIQ